MFFINNLFIKYHIFYQIAYVQSVIKHRHKVFDEQNADQKQLL